MFFIRNQHMFRADFGIRRMMVPLQEILIIMIGKREKKILFSIFACKHREDDLIYSDSEYQRKIKTSVMGYEAYYYVKDFKKEWIIWDDKEYNMISLCKGKKY